MVNFKKSSGVDKSVISERQLWKKLKNESKRITWTRLENWALFGTPDLLGYAPSGTFFTVELKYTLAYRIRFSPHQIAFHVTQPKNTFILVACAPDQLARWYPGHRILELVDSGLKLEPLCAGWKACRLELESL